MDSYSQQVQIESLYFRYAYAIDDGDFNSIAQLFGQASIQDASGKVLAQGTKQVKQFYQQIIKIYPDTNTPKTQHIVSNILILDATSDKLTAIANYTVLQKLKGGNIEAIISGRYRSTFRQVEKSWGFYKHQTEPLIIGDMSNHLEVSIRDIAKQK